MTASGPPTPCGVAALICSESVQRERGRVPAARTWADWDPDRARAVRPPAEASLLAGSVTVTVGRPSATDRQHGDHGGQFLGRGPAALDPQDRQDPRLRALVQGLVHRLTPGVGDVHRGMFPCFFGGSVSRFVRSDRRVRKPYAPATVRSIT